MKKSAILILTEMHKAAKEHPDLYDDVKVNDGVFVAAIVDVTNQLEHVKQSKQDKITAADVQPLANELTRGALSNKICRILAASGENEKEVALKIYRFLESL